jgi:hypothetical protein
MKSLPSKRRLKSYNQNSKIVMKQSVALLGRILKEKKCRWIEPDVRDKIVNFTKMKTIKTNIPVNKLFELIGVSSTKYYSWKECYELPNNHNGIIPMKHWILDWEGSNH